MTETAPAVVIGGGIAPRFGLRLVVLAMSLILGLADSVMPTAAEARDLLILNIGSEVRRGQLLSCDATACRIDKTTVPRRDILMIGLDDPPLPPPGIRNPLQDELHLRNGMVHPGPFVSLDARKVVTPPRTFERREVRSGSAWRPPRRPAARPASRREPTTGPAASGWGCSGNASRTVTRRPTISSGTRFARSTRPGSRRPRARARPGATTIGTREIQAITVLLELDEGFVREDIRGELSGPGGNRIFGSGAGEFGNQVGGGRLVTEMPLGPTYYDVGLRAVDFTYRVTVRPYSGETVQSDQGVQNIEVGRQSDPEQPRTMAAGSRVMKGQYTVTAPEGAHIVGRTVAWDLTRLTTRCDAPPPIPPLPEESEPSDGASLAGDEP